MIRIKVLTIFLALNQIDLYFGRIINGEEAQPHRFPFQVLLVCYEKKSVDEWGVNFCSGSIISNQWILTAAHCIEHSSAAKVYLGIHDLMEIPDLRNESKRRIEKDNFILHPNYVPDLLTNDIALLKVSEKIQFTKSIKSIDLPFKNGENHYSTNEKFIASGWGKINDIDPHLFTRFLKYIEVPLMPKFQCLLMYPHEIKITNICTKAVADKSICSGDSGGPLIHETEHGSKQTLIGISSAVSIKGCQLGLPSIFTDVSRYLDWISKTTGIEV